MGGTWQEISICVVCITWSLIEYTTGILAMGWWVERLGFMYGVLLAANYNKINKWIHRSWIKKTIATMIVAGILGVAYLSFKRVPFWGDYLLKIILGIAITAFMLETVSSLRVGNKVNKFLGNISYEVYLLHGIVFGVLNLIGIKFNSGVFIVGSILFTVLVSIGLQKVSKVLIKRLS